MLLQQFRYPVGEACWEIPAGKLDPNESPLQTAERELLEETGFKSSKLTRVGKFYPGVGYSNEIIHIFAAENLEEFEMNTDADEFLIRKRVPLSDAIDMVYKGEILDGKSVICLLRVWEWYKKA